MKKEAVIFDFDGVIVDSWWLSHKTSLKEYPWLTEDEHKSWFEGNIHDSWQGAGDRERIGIDYYGEFQKEMHLVKFFIGMEEVVKNLAKKYSLSIVSSSTSPIIGDYLRREGIFDCFTDILGCDVHTSKHKKIQMLFRKYDLSPADCIMVTDTVGDVKEARKAGVDSIGVSWGFHEIERLQKIETFRVVHEPKELGVAISDYFAR